jgi:hypothetical protein
MLAPIAALTLTGTLGSNPKALLRLYEGSDGTSVKLATAGEPLEIPHETLLNRVFNERGHPLPKSKSRIKTGDLVLAIDDDEIGWFEAIVVEIVNQTYVLRWRDYPEEGEFVRTAEQIALMQDPGHR